MISDIIAGMGFGMWISIGTAFAGYLWAKKNRLLPRTDLAVAEEITRLNERVETTSEIANEHQLRDSTFALNLDDLRERMKKTEGRLFTIEALLSSDEQEEKNPEIPAVIVPTRELTTEEVQDIVGKEGISPVIFTENEAEPTVESNEAPVDVSEVVQEDERPSDASLKAILSKLSPEEKAELLRRLS